MDFDVDAWREELESYRARKDEQFASSRQSPLPPAEREHFDGLEYFSPDPDYRVEATVDLDESDETVAMETTAGNHGIPPAAAPEDAEDGQADSERLYERLARLHFELEADTGETGEHTLAAYRRVDHDGGSLFVPFRDKTTGQETYPGGRYMELHVESAERTDAESSSGAGSDSRNGQLTDGAVVPLDFNLAYNPFCAYSDAYVCPLAPRENWLEVAVRAGERYES
jgi:uncharacterized protein (DUF1684 family)